MAIEDEFTYALYNSGMSKADQVKKIELGPGRKGRDAMNENVMRIESLSNRACDLLSYFIKKEAFIQEMSDHL